MTGFSSIDLKWQGKDYHIPANRVLETVAAVEEVVTVNELFAMSQSRKISTSKISKAYAQVMRSAGIKVTDEEAYERLIMGATHADAQLEMLLQLICMLLPKSTLDEAVKALSDAEKVGGTPKGKAEGPPSRFKSSRRITSSSSSGPKSSPPISFGG